MSRAQIGFHLSTICFLTFPLHPCLIGVSSVAKEILSLLLKSFALGKKRAKIKLVSKEFARIYPGGAGYQSAGRATCPTSVYAPDTTCSRHFVPAHPPVAKSCTPSGSTRALACRGWHPRQPQPTVRQPSPLNEAQRSPPPCPRPFQPTSNPQYPALCDKICQLLSPFVAYCHVLSLISEKYFFCAAPHRSLANPTSSQKHFFAKRTHFQRKKQSAPDCSPSFPRPFSMGSSNASPGTS